jgi:hypothetical protein
MEDDMIAPASKAKREPRMRGRRRASIAASAPVVEGPVSERRPTLSPGTKLVRQYRGKKIVVTVMEKGFEFDGSFYKSLSAIANKITGSHVSGNAWFGLKARPAKKEAAK